MAAESVCPDLTPAEARALLGHASTRATSTPSALLGTDGADLLRGIQKLQEALVAAEATPPPDGAAHDAAAHGARGNKQEGRAP